MDLISELGELAFASRLRRLSERLHSDGSRIYGELALDFQARWFPVLYLLSRQSPMAVTEVADALRLTHPAVNQIAAAMAKKGLLTSSKDRHDERRRLLKLSKKGEKVAATLRPVWTEIENATRDLLQEVGSNLLEAIGRIESELDRISMYDRVMSRLRAADEARVDIIEYSSKYKKHFRDLNYEWLNEYFCVEPEDELILSDPETQVIGKGGRVLFAKLNGQVVGTGALLKLDARTYELAKMAVSKEHRGHHIGLKIAEAALALARSLKATRVILHTSPQLAIAVSLYRRLGFREIESESKYSRCTIAMELALKK
jgi:DNA-binding MarR family transcriptional regulator/ribosomal protein S18 acetylase RimI-like enzyme